LKRSVDRQRYFEPCCRFVLPVTSAIAPHTAGRIRRLATDGRNFEGALLGGLAGVFLVNALVAVLQPSDFTGLVERSLIGRLAPAVTGSWTAWAIGINDLTLGILLVVSIRSRPVRSLVLAWAALWLFAVTVVKVTSLHAFGG
jgi:hypothetical protein